VKGISTTLKSIAIAVTTMAITAGPAAASSGYGWLNSSTGGDSLVAAAVAQPDEVGQSSINATLGSQGSQDQAEGAHSSINATLDGSVPQRSNDGAVGVHSSINATLGPQGSRGQAPSAHSSINAVLGKSSPDRTPAPVESSGYRSISAIMGPGEPVADEGTTPVASEPTGFDWEAASAGAVTALGLALLSLATVRTLRRQGRVSVEPRA
jgi:hypothetical protein